MDIILRYRSETERTQLLTNLKILLPSSDATLDEIEDELKQRVYDVALTLYTQGGVDVATKQIQQQAATVFTVSTEIDS